MEETYKICIYDGITIFVLDPRIFNHLYLNRKKYKLEYQYDENGEVSSIYGKWKNLDISLEKNPRGVGIRFGGSLHKLNNGSHNHNLFLWHDFEKIY